MWRREERLKYWLEGGSQTQKTSSKLGLKEKLLLKLQLWQYACAVKEVSLGVCTNAIILDCELIKNTQVKDGLGILGRHDSPIGKFLHDFADSNTFIRHLGLLETARVVNLQLPDESHARVRQEKLAITSIPRSVQVSIRAADVNMLKSFSSEMLKVRDGKRLLITHPSIQNLTSQISELPHARASIRIDQMQDTERKGFLREAEILKGLPGNRAELIAVFRHVPIEVIGRLRLLADQKAILYSISHEVKPTQTRVYDMAAIRDSSSQEVYLIPHRAQYRSVSLN
jgi:hypothetical protein